MKIQRLPIALTVVNLGLLMFLLMSQIRPVEAQPPEVPQAVARVLRGHALEIVDYKGRVRASIKVLPPVTGPDGKMYPESVILRLIDPNGRPEVKLGASVQGAGIGFVGALTRHTLVLEAQGPTSSLQLTNQDGRQQVITP